MGDCHAPGTAAVALALSPEAAARPKRTRFSSSLTRRPARPHLSPSACEASAPALRPSFRLLLPGWLPNFAFPGWLSPAPSTSPAGATFAASPCSPLGSADNLSTSYCLTLPGWLFSCSLLSLLPRFMSSTILFLFISHYMQARSLALSGLSP